MDETTIETKRTGVEGVEPTAKNALALVRKVLEEGEMDGVYLWHILTALRGPDAEGSTDLKLLTTARIRHAVLGYWGPSKVGAIVRGEAIDMRVLDAEGVSVHFANHIRHAVRACEALGYKIHEKRELSS